MSLGPAVIGSAMEMRKPFNNLAPDSNVANLPRYHGKLLIQQQSLVQKRDQEFIERFLAILEVNYHDQQETLKKQGISKSLYYFLGFTCLTGLLGAFLDGIDGIASVVELLPLPPIPSVLIVATFVVISITVFIGFEVSESARLFGIELDKSTSKPFGKISNQKNQLKKINHYLESAIIDANTPVQLQKLAREIEELIIINAKLDEQIINIANYINKAPQIIWCRKFAAVMCAFLYLNFGFFTGQAGILYLLGNITMAVAITQPLIAVTVVVIAMLSAFGYAAFYWMIQRPGVENLVSKQCFGVDLEMLETIQSNEFQSELEISLACKQKNIERYLQYHQQSKDNMPFLEGAILFLNQKKYHKPPVIKSYPYLEAEYQF